MLSEEFQSVYNVFKKNFYTSLCDNSKELTMLEAFSLDVIFMLGNPTILEYASYMGISQPNATYRINQMMDKGYLTKKVCENDKRAYQLEVTPKFLSLYRNNDKNVKDILQGMEESYSKEDIELLVKMLREIKEQMNG